MAGIPSGTVTFLFTDIEGSTKLAREHPGAWEAARTRHHAILDEAIECNNGFVFQVIGDAFCAAFSTAGDALKAAFRSQWDLYQEPWGEVPIRVRMGIHTGEAETDGKDYHGYLTMSFTQRIMSAGHGGQVLLSGTARELGRDLLPAGISLLDLGEKRLKDLLRPERLYQLVISGLPSAFPPLKTLDSFPNNLPIQVTTFIGRKTEITEVRQKLDEHRVVTLTGSGGAGKTRLSLEVGAMCLEQFKNGVWFVELAALTNPTLIISSILSALGVHEKENDIHSLANHIGNQALLLILDNCEHLVEDCALLVESLMKPCPNLHVLASSREAFGIAGEQPYHIPSLPFPDPRHLPALDQIAKCEAVQLFIERVKTYVPSFSLTEKNASAVAQICCRLDGIPLALELAAARMKVMSVEQLASRLGDMFNLLTSGRRTALPRHQTLRALIEWSYDLLSESEKLLFRRLAVFSGGWSLEAAEEVCGIEGKDSVLENLARLVDKSLVSKEELDGEARFRMLETIRQYAEFQLFASEEVEEVKNHHRDWFLQLAETAEPKLRTGEQLTWLNRLEMEHDNLRAAMKWSLEQKHVEQALRVPAALAYFWEIHGHHEEGRDWFDQAFSLEAQNTERIYPYLWAKAVNSRCRISWYLPDFRNSKPRMEEALKIFREQEDYFQTGHILYFLACIPYIAGELENAKSMYQEGLNAYQIINDTWGVGECVHCMAHVVEQQDKMEESHGLYNKSLELLKQTGDRFSLFHPMGDVAVSALNKGELAIAGSILEESIQAFEELKNREWALISANRLTDLFYEKGEYETARRINQRNLEVQREMNYLEQIGWTTELKGKIELAEGDLSSAPQIYEEALAIAEKRNDQLSIGFIKAALGLVDCHLGNFRRGKQAIELGIEKAFKEYSSVASPLLTYRCHALWLEKDLQAAAQSYRDTLQELRNNYFFIRIPECLEGLGKIAVLQSDLERAARLFGAAEALREKMGTPIPPIQRGDYDTHLQTLRERMEETFEAFRAEGRLLTMEQAITLALEP